MTMVFVSLLCHQAPPASRKLKALAIKPSGRFLWDSHHDPHTEPLLPCGHPTAHGQAAYGTGRGRPTSRLHLSRITEAPVPSLHLTALNGFW